MSNQLLLPSLSTTNTSSFIEIKEVEKQLAVKNEVIKDLSMQLHEARGLQSD